eukprot:TRINITY_DN79_c0_g1_i2.p1 TRINITY_DN79_c0_g1~~TRINITY_DN79_c0_g1_i2.p1  ORF type:complete len:1096 (+),score=332.70 TRINITY_DN79_c0_g1_i2:685-3972(+)
MLQADSNSTTAPPAGDSNHPNPADLSAECRAAIETYEANPASSQCDKALDLDKFEEGMSPLERQSALCSENGCINRLIAVFKTCEADLRTLDTSGEVKRMVIVLMAMKNLCPHHDKDAGCFVALAEYERNVAALDWDGPTKPTQVQIRGLCQDKCTRRIQKFHLLAVEASGDQSAIEGAKAHLAGRDVTCTKDRTGYYCFGDLKEMMSDSFPKPEKLCPNACLRRAFLKWAGSFGEPNARHDFRKLFKFMCAKNGDQYCSAILHDIVADTENHDDHHGDDDHHNDGGHHHDDDMCSNAVDRATAKCMEEVRNNNAACANIAVDNPDPSKTEKTVNPAIGCECADPLAKCVASNVDSKCLSYHINKEACKSYLTQCPIACAHFPDSPPPLPSPSATHQPQPGDSCDGASVVIDQCMTEVRNVPECQNFLPQGTSTPEGTVLPADTNCGCVEKLVRCQESRLPYHCIHSDQSANNCKTALANTQCTKVCEILIPHDHSNDVCQNYDMEVKTASCIAHVEATNTHCHGKIVKPGTLEVLNDVPCDCIDKVISCQVTNSPPDCIKKQSVVEGCQKTLANTQCVASCQGYVSSPISTPTATSQPHHGVCGTVNPDEKAELCMRYVEHTYSECQDMRVPSTGTTPSNKVRDDVPCSCVDRVIRCQIEGLPAECIRSHSVADGCKQHIAHTQCTASCDAYRPDSTATGSNSGQASSPVPNAVSPTPNAVSPTPNAVSPTPNAVSPTPSGSSTTTTTTTAGGSTLRALSTSGSYVHSPFFAPQRVHSIRRLDRLFTISETTPSPDHNNNNNNDDDDVCRGLDSTPATCAAGCKAMVAPFATRLGCCIPVIVRTLGTVSPDGELRELRRIAHSVNAAVNACDIAQQDASKCVNKGRVRGRLVLGSVTKQVVDQNKDKFYANFKADLSASCGVHPDDVTVTGHEAVTTSARRILQSGSGVAFNYELATEDSASANLIKENFDAEISQGEVDLPSTTAELAEADPIAITSASSGEVAIDSAASQSNAGASTGTSEAGAGTWSTSGSTLWIVVGAGAFGVIASAGVIAALVRRRRSTSNATQHALRKSKHKSVSSPSHSVDSAESNV